VTLIGITGGTGYVGGRLVQRLTAHGSWVRIVDNQSGPVCSEDPKIPPLKVDFFSDKGLEWMEDCDVILHLAARSGVVACARDPEGTWKVNVDGTKRLVNWCREKKKPIAFASSFSVTGIPASLPITESTPANPPHAYAKQKTEGEKIMKTLSDPGGSLGAVLRMSNLFGSYDVNGTRIAKGNVLNLYAEQAGTGGPLKVFAPGTQRRDYIHIDDVVAHWEAVAKYLLKTGRPPEVPTFNVASGESVTVIELAQKVCDEWKTMYPKRPPLSSAVVENPRADVEILHPEFAVDTAWTKQTLGVKCERDLTYGIREMLKMVKPQAGGFRASTTR
jgi:nucleoside-diphosphate-sugar epimerase